MQNEIYNIPGFMFFGQKKSIIFLTQYQHLHDSIIPSDIWDKSTVMDDEKQTYHRMDVLWHYLSSLRYADNSLRYPRLTRVGKVVLTIPHSSAEEERLFSMVRKNKTALDLT